MLSGVDVLLVYGNPNYYGKLGFRIDITQLFQPPYSLKYLFGWLGMNVTGIGFDSITMKFRCVDSLTSKN